MQGSQLESGQVSTRSWWPTVLLKLMPRPCVVEAHARSYRKCPAGGADATVQGYGINEGVTARLEQIRLLTPTQK
jgi:hypothetical protein